MVDMLKLLKDEKFIVPVGSFLTLILIVYARQSIFILPALVLVSAAMLVPHFSFRHLRFFVLIGVLGCLAEVYAIYHGAWTYDTPQFAGIPFYLFFCWANAGLAVEYLERKIMKR